jgi:hypothetical protein
MFQDVAELSSVSSSTELAGRLLSIESSSVPEYLARGDLALGRDFGEASLVSTVVPKAEC